MADKRNSYRKLGEMASGSMKDAHLRSLVKCEARNRRMFVEAEGIAMDFRRQRLDEAGLDALLELAKEQKVEETIKKMFRGEKINQTEGRAVLHIALRSPPDAVIAVDGANVVPSVHEVLGQIKAFSAAIRGGKKVGYTGQKLKDVVCIGIGGSFLGPEFVFEALRTDPKGAEAATGRRLRFLANVDPIDVTRALDGFNPETTLVIVISKTFTTAETMLNARTVKDWLLKTFKTDAAIGKHFAACSTNLKATSEFGIAPENVFGFWDWVGGRFSVTSAVGVLPLALQYGYDVVQEFLNGAHQMDTHFATQPLHRNLPVLMGLLAHWNRNHLGHSSVAILPYCQALLRFAAHIQQLNMESNGKGVTMSGERISYPTGPIIFGEPGTNGQHSFYQLMHQGEIVPAEFIGFIKSQNPVNLPGEPVSNHDELMSNFFAQPDALAFGKTLDQLEAEGVPVSLRQHKLFEGNRPSIQLLLPECNAHYVGALLALYEHRTAVEGFLLEVNSYDQWGVELGKVLAKDVRNYLSAKRKNESDKVIDEAKVKIAPLSMDMLRLYVEG